MAVGFRLADGARRGVRGDDAYLGSTFAVLVVPIGLMGSLGYRASCGRVLLIERLESPSRCLSDASIRYSHRAMPRWVRESLSLLILEGALASPTRR